MSGTEPPAILAARRVDRTAGARPAGEPSPAALSTWPDAPQDPGAAIVRGSVDVVAPTEVSGWAYSPGRRTPVTVQAVLNHEIVGEAVANLHRADLAAAGLGDGHSGYSMQLFRTIDPLYLPFLIVKVDGGDTELPRAPLLGVREFFASLYRAHPAAGRPRSVLGGLWTDRTNAAALLRGKTEIGQIPPDASAGIADLIEAGFHIADLGGRAALLASENALADQIGAILETGSLLPLLRAVLEDDPVVVRADRVWEDEFALAQPSARNPSPSPAECLALVVPVAEGVVLDVVRDSHRLPEFTPHGLSRWATAEAGAGIGIAGASGLLDRHDLAVGAVAVVGPGTLHRLRFARGAALRILCLPSRGLPLAVAADPARREAVRASGVRVWL